MSQKLSHVKHDRRYRVLITKSHSNFYMTERRSFYPSDATKIRLHMKQGHGHEHGRGSTRTDTLTVTVMDAGNDYKQCSK